MLGLCLLQGLAFAMVSGTPNTSPEGIKGWIDGLENMKTSRDEQEGWGGLMHSSNLCFNLCFKSLIYVKIYVQHVVFFQSKMAFKKKKSDRNLS